MTYVIVGGGIAGTTAAEELRKLQPDAEITIVSEEQHPCYSRVLLPHYVKGKIPREKIFLKKETWYAEKNIEWITGERVVSFDPRNKHVVLESNRELPYDKLLIASGGEIRPLVEDVRGVSYFRTADDADHMLQLIRELPAGTMGAVYGGGFIACEYINIFKRFEVPCVVAHRGPHFWSRILDAESGALIAKKLAEGGVKVISNATLQGFTGEDHVEAMITDKEAVACSMVGAGIGIAPELSWIKDAGVEVAHGVRANEYLETNIPDVFTAGDVTEFFDLTVGRHRMAGNWMSAQTQGRTVAKTMAGERTEFKLVSSYSTNVLGLEIIFIGDTDRAAATEVRTFGSVELGGVTQLFARDGKVVGATLVNRNHDRAAITKWISEGTDIHTISIDVPLKT